MESEIFHAFIILMIMAYSLWNPQIQKLQQNIKLKDSIHRNVGPLIIMHMYSLSTWFGPIATWMLSLWNC